MLTPEHLEVAAHSLTAILAVWLGITVLSRSGERSGRVFGFLAMALVAWSTSIIVERLSTSVAAVAGAHAIEELAAALVIPATAHFSLVIASNGRPSRRQRAVLLACYVLNVAAALPGAIDPTKGLSIVAPRLEVGPLDGALLGWAWIGLRLGIMVLAAAWLASAWRTARGEGTARRRQLAVTFATVVVGAVGGSIRLVSVLGPTEPWIGVSLVTLAMVLSASVVFRGRIFFGPEVAGRAFWRSFGLGLAVFLFVGLIVGVDALSRRFLGLDLPLFSAVALMLTIALYEPLVGWARARIGNPTAAEVARRRLLIALGEPAFDPQAADAGVRPALARLVRALGLTGATVAAADGTVLATEGTIPSSLAEAVPLLVNDVRVGDLRVGPTTSGQALAEADRVLLDLSARYIAAAVRTGRAETEQAEALTDLSLQRSDVEASAARLREALVDREPPPMPLRVFALGPLRVELGNAPIERWGGEKAGTRQAQGLFAFLFDRGERGMAKDEALDLIWPDTDVERADLAFHRTLGGLRHVLEAGGWQHGGIRFHNDRYRLDPRMVGWSDVATFIAGIEAAAGGDGGAERLARLEEIRGLYRGEYLDDCPFYGDSAQVEARRASLRARFVDLLLTLGEGYESLGSRASAAAAYRDALATATDGCAPAEAGLTRLGAVPAASAVPP